MLRNSITTKDARCFFDIVNLNRLLNTFEYATYTDKKELKKGFISKEYRSMTPEEFENKKAGICWDYTTYEAYWFENNQPKIYYNLYYLETNNGSSTHTWLAFRWIDSKWYIFESSLDGHNGVFSFKTENELVSYYSNELTKDLIDKSHVVYKYNPPNKYNLTAKEFVDYVLHSGTKIRETGNYSSKYIIPYLEK